MRNKAKKGPGDEGIVRRNPANSYKYQVCEMLKTMEARPACEVSSPDQRSIHVYVQQCKHTQHVHVQINYM